MDSRPLILVTNDDSVYAPGIRALAESVESLGEVVVVAPERPHSGMSHAITIDRPLRIQKVDIIPGITTYRCSGTPVDCVKLACSQVLKRLPDICVSGINHGSNHSTNIIYSGTMAAALEIAVQGVSAIGFSLVNYDIKADLRVAKDAAFKLTKYVLEVASSQNMLLNVNIPAVSPKEYNGIRVARQAKGRWVENYEKRIDPKGKDYYWIKGHFESLEDENDTDIWALDHHYTAVVPIQFDYTDYKLKQELENAWPVKGKP